MTGTKQNDGVVVDDDGDEWSVLASYLPNTPQECSIIKREGQPPCLFECGHVFKAAEGWRFHEGNGTTWDVIGAEWVRFNPSRENQGYSL